MGRDHTFYDETFRKNDFDPNDSGDFERNLVFVIMPFDKKMDKFYEIMKVECKKLGLHTERADDGIGSGMIIRDVVDLIEKAEFIICDLTDEKPNVYYELGYAHGVGNEPDEILLIKYDNINTNFDISHLRIYKYSSPEELREIISKKLSNMIKKVRSKY